MRRWLVIALASCTVAQALAQPSPRDARGDLGDLSRPVLVSDGPSGSGPIILSGGTATPAEIKRFADVWMSDSSRADVLGSACGMLYKRMLADRHTFEVFSTFHTAGAFVGVELEEGPLPIKSPSAKKDRPPDKPSRGS